jgi:hypothetical protein
MSNDSDPSSLRGKPELLLEWAQNAHKQSKSTHDIVRAIYGVDFPAELYLFNRVRASEASIDFFFFPWELIALEVVGHKSDSIDGWSEEQEAYALAANPAFIPLMKLGGNDDVRHNGYILGYDLQSLKKSGTTILGHKEDIPPSGAAFVTIGNSLLDVVHEWTADAFQKIKSQYESPSNRGFGSLTYEDVETAKRNLEMVEEMRQELAKASLA